MLDVGCWVFDVQTILVQAWSRCGPRPGWRDDRSAALVPTRPAIRGAARQLLGRATPPRQCQGAAGPAKKWARRRAGPRRRGEPKKEPVPEAARNLATQTADAPGP